ncbi:hypothetical protein ALC53_04846, partial [Atta colombica]
IGCTLARYAPKREVVTVNGRLLGQSQACRECDPTTSPTGFPTVNSTVVARLFFRTRLADLCLTVWPIGLPCDCREGSFRAHKKTTQTDATGPSYIRAGGESDLCCLYRDITHGYPLEQYFSNDWWEAPWCLSEAPKNVLFKLR